MKSNLSILFAIFLMSFNTVAESKKSINWKIKHTSWTRFHEKSYEDFVSTLGKAKKNGVCHTTNNCLKSSVANPNYSSKNPSALRSIFADCADLPYILRGYFAWMNDLPFSYPNALQSAAYSLPKNQALWAEIKLLQKELYKTKGFFKKKKLKRKIKKLKKKINGGKKKIDIRYNAHGNVISSKRFIKSGDNILEVLRSISGSISTATFRTNASKLDSGSKFRDTYPVKLDRKFIKPGTVLYDPNGHIAVVYNITDNGKIQLIDAHPDNSLTAITYGEKFSRTDVYIGGGFSNWRPFSMNGNNIKAASNEELEGYSLEQFFGNTGYNRNWQQSNFTFKGESLDYYEYVRYSLSKGDLKYDPILELGELLDELCLDFKERNHSVNLAIKAGMNKQSHPDRLPNNIYGTDGEWETFSTPSRDARFKASIREGRKLMIKLISAHRKGSASVSYTGTDLVGHLIDTYEKKTNSCRIEFNDSANERVKLDLDGAIEGVYNLSFDPYHCIEQRWGILNGNCSQSRELNLWYDAQSGLRNRIDRDYSMKMDFYLDELASAAVSDVEEENISIKEVLK